MKIITFNLNGVRAAEKKGLSTWIEKENPDLLCVQELKAQEGQIPDTLLNLGYFFNASYATRKGYSGVATFSKIKPVSTTNKISLDWMNEEGRILINEYESFMLINLYTPSGSSGKHRQDFKEMFMEQFPDWLETLRKPELPIIICTDMNIAHTETDIHNPKANKKSPGFLPEERKWLTDFLGSDFIDSFRHLNPEESGRYSWWSYRAKARERNKGWRIDYILVDTQLIKRCTSCTILDHVVLSDHAPVQLTIES